MSPKQSRLQNLLSRWSWWLLPSLTLGAIAVAFCLLRAMGPRLPLIIMGAALALGLAWILVSSLNPAAADRTCPECGEEGLERLDPDATRGVVCSRCGHIDRDVSSWFLAEEETLLEEIVLAERARPQGREPVERSKDGTPNTEITE